MNSAVSLTVIIPTRNRADSLRRLLASIRATEGTVEADIEVCVVDNGSSDNTQSVVTAERALFQIYKIDCLLELEEGKASALNRGLSVARGRIIMVLDDDVVVERLALCKHLASYDDSQFDAVQGRILPGVDPAGRHAVADRIREYNIPMIDYGDEIRAIRGLTGTNMSFRREVFETIGGFDTRLGPGAAGFSEDTEFSIRTRTAGFKIGYTPHAVVFHELNPARYGSAYNRQVEYLKGKSRSIYRRDSIPFRVIPDLFVNCIRYGFYWLIGDRQKAYKTEGRIMKHYGYLAGKARKYC